MKSVLSAILAAACVLLLAGLVSSWLLIPPSPSGGAALVPPPPGAPVRPAVEDEPSSDRLRPEPEPDAPALPPDDPVGAGGVDAVDAEVPGPAAVVSGYLGGPAGEPVAGRAVFLHSPSRDRRFRVLTGESGVFTIDAVPPADDYVLSVYAAEGLAGLEKTPLVVGSRGLHLELHLEPAATGTLEGWLVDASGSPVTPGFELWMRSPGSRELRPVRADSSGFFRLEDVPTGDVVLESRGGPRVTVRGIRVPSGGVETVTVRLGAGPHALAGAVVGEDGRPVASAEVRLHWAHRGDGVQSAAFRSALSDALGRFTFSGLGAGPHDLDVSASGFRSARVAHEAGRDPVEVIVRLSRAGDP